MFLENKNKTCIAVPTCLSPVEIEVGGGAARYALSIDLLCPWV